MSASSATSYPARPNPSSPSSTTALGKIPVGRSSISHGTWLFICCSLQARRVGKPDGVRNYESLYIPGILQAEDYARAVIRGVLPTASQDEVQLRVQARMERQEVLTKDEPLKLWAIIDEAALHRMVGGHAVMRAQMERLITATHEPQVTVQVISLEAGAHPGMAGSFILLDFADPSYPEVVYIESMAGDLFLEAGADVRRYSVVFDNLRAVALGPSDSASLIATPVGKIK